MGNYLGGEIPKEAKPVKIRSQEEVIKIWIKCYRGSYCYYFEFEDGTGEPYTGTIERPMTDIDADLSVIIKALERSPLRRVSLLLSSKETIQTIDDSIYEKKGRGLVFQTISLMASRDVTLTFVETAKNRAAGFLEYDRVRNLF